MPKMTMRMLRTRMLKMTSLRIIILRRSVRITRMKRLQMRRGMNRMTQVRWKEIMMGIVRMSRLMSRMKMRIIRM